MTPLTVPIEPGQHALVLSQGTTTSDRQRAARGHGDRGRRAGACGKAPGPDGCSAAARLQVSEGGSLLGTTSAARLMLPAGRHDLELANAALGRRLVSRRAGGKDGDACGGCAQRIALVNASPWANVWLDGRAIGTTPLANLDVPLGTHEIIWRHPQLGERRQTVVVTAKAPARVGMDLGK